MKVEGYNPQFDFKIDLDFGHEGETQLIDFFNLVKDGKVEVKTDRYRNGRMAVETQQKPHGRDWQNSGINVTTAHWWAYRFAPESYVFVSVQRLKNYLMYKREVLEKIQFATYSDNPARGFLLYPDDVHEMQTGVIFDPIQPVKP